jgi:hypothetical protein
VVGAIGTRSLALVHRRIVQTSSPRVITVIMLIAIYATMVVMWHRGADWPHTIAAGLVACLVSGVVVVVAAVALARIF